MVQQDQSRSCSQVMPYDDQMLLSYAAAKTWKRM